MSIIGRAARRRRHGADRRIRRRSRHGAPASGRGAAGIRTRRRSRRGRARARSSAAADLAAARWPTRISSLVGGAGRRPPAHGPRDVLDRAPAGCTVTDVGSTKRPGLRCGRGGRARFVGGHPICGAETRGPDRASAELFEGATWFLTPTATTSPERLRLRARLRQRRSARDLSRSGRTRTTGSSP